MESFDPSDIMTGKSEIGFDGIAILLNGHIVTALQETQQYNKNNSNIVVTFVLFRLSVAPVLMVARFQQLSSRIL